MSKDKSGDDENLVEIEFEKKEENLSEATIKVLDLSNGNSLLVA